MGNIEIIEENVNKVLQNDNSGHGIEHALRVVEIASKIAENENADCEIVKAIALLHDVDDYKLFGEDFAQNLTNAKMILNQTSYDDSVKERILNSIKTMGYSKRMD